MSAWEHIEVRVPYKKPPLTANQRLGWRQRAVITRRVRGEAKLLMRSKGVKRPPLAPGERLQVQLVYYPATKRRRDQDNLVPTLKVLCDGIVDSGLVVDDTPAYMDKLMPVIAEPVAPSESGLALRLTVLKPLAHTHA